jgi:dTDP-glucose 4,6-dehydratase
MDTFLVTGGSGFIGSALCDYLLNKYKDVRVINVSKQTYATNLKIIRFLEEYGERYISRALDFNDTLHLYELLTKYEVKRFYHLGAETHVDRAFLYPQDFLWSNVQGTFSILEAIRFMKQKPTLYYMSTDEVFGDVTTGFKREDEVLHPENPYVASKVAAEAYCITWKCCFDIPLVIGRSMNVFGQRQNPEKLIAKIITHILLDKQYTLYTGNSLRGWSYVYDTVDAIDTITTKGNNGDVYHIPPSCFKTVNEVNESILDITGKHSLFLGYKGERLKDDHRYALNCVRMRRELKWEPKMSWDQGIKQTIKWYETNKELWVNEVI